MKLSINKSITEEKLIDGCVKGKSWAQKSLYEKYSPLMLGVCIRYLKDRDDADDVLVQGFMKVFSNISKFRNEGSFEGWIRRIMVNECLTFIRKNRSMYLETDIEKAENDPDYSVLDSQLEADDLIRMIQELPVGYRTVFNLYAIEGYSHAEIAEQLGINVNTSKSQLSRARAFLQKQLLEAEKKLNSKIIGDEY
ncbi:MAG: sigma-70 family RNA polymerase sigma factor [bacterium]|nr:sigma-70 family RNA polymerase sigma factor [bacterium]